MRDVALSHPFAEAWETPSAQPQPRPAPHSFAHPAARFLPPAVVVCPDASDFDGHRSCGPTCELRKALDAWDRHRYGNPPPEVSGMKGRRRRWALLGWRLTIDRERRAG